MLQPFKSRFQPRDALRRQIHRLIVRRRAAAPLSAGDLHMVILLHMALVKKLIPFLIIFGTIFYFIRTSSLYDTRLLLSNIDETPYLYAGLVPSLAYSPVLRSNKNGRNGTRSPTRCAARWTAWKNYIYGPVISRKNKRCDPYEIKRYLELIIKEVGDTVKKGKSQKWRISSPISIIVSIKFLTRRRSSCRLRSRCSRPC